MSDEKEKKKNDKEKDKEDAGATAAGAVTSLTVTVSPFDRDGRHVQCDIGGPAAGPARVSGGVIFLAAGNAFDITFDLLDGEEPTLEWDQDPLWIERNRCPRTHVVNAPFRDPGTASPKRSNVKVDASGSAGVLHYRMNFRRNGQLVYCDPVIIHD